MSVRIMVSYSEEEELQPVLNLLKPITYKHKVAKEKKGKFRNAYIEVKQEKTL